MGGKILRRTEKDISGRIKRTKKIIFFLGYDGTLVPIRKKPHLARLDGNTRKLLRQISRKSWAKIFIISGRSLKDVKNLVGLKTLYYIGNHGIEAEGPGLHYINPKARSLKRAIQKSYTILKKNLRIKGAIVENKTYTLSLHYRLVSPGRIPELVKIFNETIKNLKKSKKVKITEGKKVFEVRPNIKWDKGAVTRWILKKKNLKKYLPICIGDDKTDEDAFKVLRNRGITALVSKKRQKTYAKYRIALPSEVVKFLEWILQIRNPMFPHGECNEGFHTRKRVEGR